MLDVLQQVLDEAHDGHTYISDKEQYSVSEYWTQSLYGDCEDFALSVRALLEEKGILSNLIFCKAENGVGHLVVEVGGWILDNRHKWVVARDNLSYTWISLGTPEGVWFEIEE